MKFYCIINFNLVQTAFIEENTTRNGENSDSKTATSERKSLLIITFAA